MSVNDLTFYSGFNYQKHQLIGSQTVSIPPTSPFTPVTVLTVPTGLNYVPTARMSFDYAGERGIYIPALIALGVTISAYLDTSFNFVAVATNSDIVSHSVTINFRVYLDQ